MPFYQGLSASLMSTIPHSGINMSVYEGLKQRIEFLLFLFLLLCVCIIFVLCVYVEF